MPASLHEFPHLILDIIPWHMLAEMDFLLVRDERIGVCIAARGIVYEAHTVEMPAEFLVCALNFLLRRHPRPVFPVKVVGGRIVGVKYHLVDISLAVKRGVSFFRKGKVFTVREEVDDPGGVGEHIDDTVFGLRYRHNAFFAGKMKYRLRYIRVGGLVFAPPLEQLGAVDDAIVIGAQGAVDDAGLHVLLLIQATVESVDVSFECRLRRDILRHALREHGQVDWFHAVDVYKPG